MPTSFEPDPGSAVAAARAEAELWIDLARGWRLTNWDDVAPTEQAVVGFVDPGADLDRRASQWGHEFTGHELADIAAFCAGLAAAEADGWQRGDHPLATRAYTERRMLLGDRVLHWAVPWLDAIGRCYPELRGAAFSGRESLLDIADLSRPAPALTGSEGLAPPGEDSYGPIGIDADLGRYVRSVWSGLVLLDATVESVTGGEEQADLADAGPQRRDLATLFGVVPARWRSLAGRHDGSARLWDDLAVRAERTAAALSG